MLRSSTAQKQFADVKEACRVKSKEEPPQLTPELRQWVMELTSQIMADIAARPHEVSSTMDAVVATVFPDLSARRAD